MFDKNAAYAALAAKDNRFDGVFFVGVSSTGVYCRPVCTAKTPKPENCTFFSSAAEAEKSGYRPCLLCRPELAPGNAAVDAEKRIADSAIAIIENNLSPTAIRKKAATVTDGEGITLTLQYRPPYRWDSLVDFLSSRCISGVEFVEDNIYRRAVIIGSGEKQLRGWIACGNLPGRNAITVTMSRELLPTASRVTAKVRHMFDLDAHPDTIAKRLSDMGDLFIPGMRLCGAFDGFELAVRAVLGQQITVKAARTLAGRFTSAFGKPLATPFKEITHTFPTPEDIAKLEGINEIAKLGIIAARARTIIALAKACAAGELTLSPASNVKHETEKLLRLPGIGQWTANYIAMRAMGWADAFMPTDYGIKKALPGRTEKEIITAAENWSPWRAYAAMMLWNSLEK